MRVVRHADHTEIFLDKEEVMKFCRPGAGADTCVWVATGPNGFECLYYWRHEGRNLSDGQTLEQRWKAGKTVAKRDGCEIVKTLV